VSDHIVGFDPYFTPKERLFMCQIEKPHINCSGIRVSSQVPQKTVYYVNIARFTKLQEKATPRAILNQVKTQIGYDVDIELFAKVLQESQHNKFLT
jgi:hypothetical protein